MDPVVSLKQVEGARPGVDAVVSLKQVEGARPGVDPVVSLKQVEGARPGVDPVVSLKRFKRGHPEVKTILALLDKVQTCKKSSKTFFTYSIFKGKPIQLTNQFKKSSSSSKGFQKTTTTKRNERPPEGPEASRKMWPGEPSRSKKNVVLMQNEALLLKIMLYCYIN